MFRSIFSVIISSILLFSCNTHPKKIVELSFVDSLIDHYSKTVLQKTNEGDLLFWKKRMESFPDNFLNGPKYALALVSRFHLYGNIHDLRTADSLMQQSNLANKEIEDGIFLSLAGLALLQHQFLQADTLTKKAISLGGNKYGNILTEFDAAFELGDYKTAGNIIKTIKPDNTYAYYFRRSKYEHYNGLLDTSISYMLKAAKEAESYPYLMQVALSNAADLCIHKADLQKAYDLYKQCVKIDASDMHSILGIGWIALMHDKNDSLAEKIFSFAQHYNQAPDALLKMEQLAEEREDSTMQKKYGLQFSSAVCDNIFGQMYNKYLIDLYTGVLNNPAKALQLAQEEIKTRHTPQTFAWYAWCLFCNNKTDEAYKIYKATVSGKPLEGLELYYMGKMMKGINKGYDAQQFFKAAYKNRYDLSSSKVADIEKILEE